MSLRVHGAGGRPGSRAVAVAALAAGLALSGCGSEADEPDGPPKVVIRDHRFDPPDLQIEAGETVTFVSRSDLPHSAKDDARGFVDPSPQPGQTKHDGSEIKRASRIGFATHSFYRDEVQKVVFPVARKYSYYCAFYPEMKGTIEVSARGKD